MIEPTKVAQVSIRTERHHRLLVPTHKSLRIPNCSILSPDLGVPKERVEEVAIKQTHATRLPVVRRYGYVDDLTFVYRYRRHWLTVLADESTLEWKCFVLICHAEYGWHYRMQAHALLQPVQLAAA